MGSSADGLSLGLIIAGIWGFLGLVYFIWFLWSLSRLFPKIGLPASHGWIPIWNQWQLINRAGYPGWIVLLVLVPAIGSIIVLVFWILTLVRINREFGKGGGYTVLGLLIPPLWAMALANHIEMGQLSVIKVGDAPYTPPGYQAPQAPPTSRAPGTAPQGQAMQTPPIAAPSAARQTPPWQPQPTQAGTQPNASNEMPAVPPTSSAPARKDWGFSNTTEDAYEKLAAENAPPQARQNLTNEVPRPYAWPEATPQPPPPGTVDVPPPAAAPPAAAPPPAAPPAAPPAPAAPPVAEPLSSPDPAPVVPAPVDPTPVDPAPADPAPQHPQSAVSSVPPQMPPASHDPDVEDDRTVVVPRRTRWGLELPDGEVLELDGNDVIVGRKPSGDGNLLTIADPTRTVSKIHARFRRVNDHWTIEDLHSTNGVALIDRGGEPVPIDPETPTETTERLLIGTLEVKLREL